MNWKPWLLVAAALCSSAVSGADRWPQFRGPDGQGNSDAKNLPIEWSETNHVQWKTPIHGRAWACPVICDNQIWFTTAPEDGKELYAICVDSETGKITRDLKIFDVVKPQYCIPFNTYASPSPVIEESRVYVTFGAPGTACLDTKTGTILWERRDLECNHFRSAGSSPILYEDKLIMHFDGSDFQYVVALDKKTGKTLWKVDRSIDWQDLNAEGKPKDSGDFRKAFSTPLIANFDGQPPILLSLGSKALYAYQPNDGKELWRLEERQCFSGSARPVVGKDRIYYCAGFSSGQLLAVKPGGSGIVTESHILWRVKKDVSLKPSILLVGDYLFMVDDNGTATFIRSDNGEVVARQKIGGHFSASPLHADGRIYTFSEEGKTTVLADQPPVKILAENTLADGFMASPAVAGNSLILRTKTALYRIAK
jgi:outer membrane protein assembly factor BamB